MFSYVLQGKDIFLFAHRHNYCGEGKIILFHFNFDRIGYCFVSLHFILQNVNKKWKMSVGSDYTFIAKVLFKK